MSLTEGNIWKQILFFTIPLLLGNLFQQLYNTVDVIVVGNFVGRDALAAVGSSNSIINMLVGFFMGVSTGASAVISQFFGAGNKHKLHDAVHATFFMTFILGILFTIIGIIASPWLLQVIKTPQKVMDNGLIYLRIYFLGIMALMVYNMGSAVLRAVGDSKRPLYFLIICSIINVVLDVAFVVWFDMGIAGVAWATLIAQTTSAVLVLWALMNTTESYRLILKDIKLDIEMLKRVLSIGLPGGIQQSVTAVSNVMVQAYINQFGSAAIAGFSAYLKIDIFLFMPMQSISLAVVTFVGQNLGAGKIVRAKKGVNVSLIIALVTNILACTVLFFCGNSVIGIFSPDPDVLYYGNMLIKMLMPLYFTLAICMVYAGAMRGFGEGVPPMIVMTGSFVVARQIFLFFGTKISHSYEVIALGYPVTWIISGIAMYLWYKKGGWEKHHPWIIEAEQKERKALDEKIEIDRNI